MEGFVNRPLVRLREKGFVLAGHPQKHDIKKWKIWASENIDEITCLMNDEQIIEKCIEESESLLKEAFEILKTVLPEDSGFDPDFWLQIFSRRMK